MSIPESRESNLPGDIQLETKDDVIRELVQSEISDYIHARQKRRSLFPRAALVGFLAGTISVLFKAGIQAGVHLRDSTIQWAHANPYFGWLLPVTLAAMGVAVSVYLVRHYAPEAAGSGIPHLEAVLHRYTDLRWKRVLPVKFFGGLMALGAGLALGQEGPTVQMGGTAGSAVSDWLKVGTQDRLTLIAAGAGAGLAAAFNAPLAGLIFVLEEVQKDFRQAVFGATFIAAATADVVTRLASGQIPVYNVPSYPVPVLGALPIFAFLGVCCGFLGVLYNRSLIFTLNRFAKLPSKHTILIASIVGGVVGLVAWFNPGLVGGGRSLSEEFLAGNGVFSVIILVFIARFILSMVSYGTGAPGGIFAPLLVLGSLIGLAVGEVGHHLFPGVVHIPAIYAVVGMAAYFTAIVRAPLTGIVLIIEMTGSYAQMLPLLVASFCSYAVAEMTGEMPIYDHLLERSLLKEGALPEPTEPLVIEIEIEAGSAFAGKEVKDLGLPAGCILISCRQGANEWIPTAMSRLEAHVRVTAVISPQAKGALHALRKGCEAP